MPNTQTHVIAPDFMKTLREKLTNSEQYTDEQLNRAAWFMVAAPMQVAGQLGAADASSAAVYTTTNLYAASIMAEFIDAGCINIEAVDKYMDRFFEDDGDADKDS